MSDFDSQGDLGNIIGFLGDGELVTGRPHGLFIAGYDPARLYPYL